MKTLFGKILIIYMVILGITFVAINYGTSKAMENFFMKKKEEALLLQAQKIELEYQIAYNLGPVNVERLNFQLEALDKYLDARIWLITKDKRVYVNTRKDKESLYREKLTINELQQVLDGHIVKKKGNFKEIFKEPVLTIGYPIKVNSKVQMALFMHASIPEIIKTTRDIKYITFISTILSFIIATGILSIFTKKITKDIKNLNSAIQIISKGNFEQKLSSKRNDELGQLADSFNQMTSRLKSFENARKDFISNLSHDFRSPLTSIKGFIGAILDGTISAKEQSKYLQRVMSEVTRLENLTENLLELSRMQKGEIPLKLEKVNIAQLLLNQLDRLETIINKKEIEIIIDVNQRLNAIADSVLLERAIQNLLDNATKFTPERGWIKIHTDENDDKIWISIQNNGVDLKESQKNKIWQRFYKIDKSRGKDKNGFGLGLSIVQDIISKHQQEIIMKNENEVIEFKFSIQKDK